MSRRRPRRQGQDLRGERTGCEEADEDRLRPGRLGTTEPEHRYTLRSDFSTFLASVIRFECSDHLMAFFLTRYKGHTYSKPSLAKLFQERHTRCPDLVAWLA